MLFYHNISCTNAPQSYVYATLLARKLANYFRMSLQSCAQQTWRLLCWSLTANPVVWSQIIKRGWTYLKNTDEKTAHRKLLLCRGLLYKSTDSSCCAFQASETLEFVCFKISTPSNIFVFHISPYNCGSRHKFPLSSQRAVCFVRRAISRRFH